MQLKSGIIQVSSEEGFPLKKRETMILELLSQHGKMEVTSLAEQVGVSGRSGKQGYPQAGAWLRLLWRKR